ncbi:MULTISPECIES: hypothetical protein [Enterococcus]|uniref:hypothetical protein n=1 Tax=Enterococcus TaxID=1350 RepID=UPI0001B6CB63|nr:MULTISPECIES: hypothetical protein [Enterococcus]EEV60292.1 predicted protein [Enterococcus faecium Com12]EGP5444121.1 hypothetical protein [Enterococcus faecium]EME8261566.1 hypothetical protein [Enterococcus faecium]MEB5660270.1 hypothetical protein [Enterococcus faecium]RIX95242.1 hypothetical protein D3Y30_03920 [Enterococcus faecium TX1330]
MRYSVYHPSSMDWLDVKTSSITDFLSEYKVSLHKELVQSSISRLKSYTDNSSKNPVILTLGQCRIEFKGIHEAIETIRGLQYALENLSLK